MIAAHAVFAYRTTDDRGGKQYVIESNSETSSSDATGVQALLLVNGRVQSLLARRYEYS